MLHGTCLQCVEFFFIHQYVQPCLSKNPKYTLYTLKSLLTLAYYCMSRDLSLVVVCPSLDNDVRAIYFVLFDRSFWNLNKIILGTEQRLWLIWMILLVFVSGQLAQRVGNCTFCFYEWNIYSFANFEQKLLMFLVPYEILFSNIPTDYAWILLSSLVFVFIFRT